MHVIAVLAFLQLLSTATMEEAIPSMMDSLIAGNGEAVVNMISSEGLQMVDSVLTHNPQQISDIALFFGVQIEAFDPDNTNSRELLTSILSQPSVSGMVLLFGMTPVDPVARNERVFVPVHWGLFGERRTIYFEIVLEEESWKVRDFFIEIPE